MHQPMEQTVVARYTFKADHAKDFLDGGRLVMEVGDILLDEATDYINQFQYALDEASILVDGKKVVHMSDFMEAVDEVDE